MQRLALIDENGLLTSLGNKWRVDSSYGDACEEILRDNYPDELGVLTDADGSPDDLKIRTWFSHKGFGDANARQMTATYVMIAKKQLPELPTTDSDTTKRQGSKPKKSAVKSPKPPKVEKQDEFVAPMTPASPANSNGGPTVHLDIQIHIPADATPEQIDQIFSSMSRHLYSK
ncbi:MAG: hypothetical protein OXH78_06660 [Acidimicrobiaceae bacterium]|nr:hypothetical protein [Acidimicrobiaceae bacterium]